MTTQEFRAWADLHCEHTGADEQAAAVIAANIDTILNRWHATYPELCECTTRMIEAGVNPKFANEHTNTIKAQLDIIRSERAEREQTLANITAPGKRIDGCDCPQCIPPDGSVEWQEASARLKEWIRVNGEMTSGGFFKAIPKHKPFKETPRR